LEGGIDSIFKELKMDYTGERFIPLDNLMNDETAFEHLHRYHTVGKMIEGKVVLDIASGEGYGSAILAKSAQKVFGIDIDPEVVKYAREKYSEISNIEFLIGRAENIPLPDHSIDVVVSYETIEHLDQPTQEKFLQEIKRILKEDGSLVISTPDKANYSDRYDYTNKFHVKEFTSEEFLDFLKNYFEHIIPYVQGFEIVSAITEMEPQKVNHIHAANWERSTHPFSRKYLVNVCSERAFPKKPEFSSIVFQVNKDFLQMTDRIVEMEAHILELGTWGHRLDKEIEERNILFGQKIKELEETRAENEKQSAMLQKITADLENKSKMVESFGLGFQEMAAKLLEMQKRLFEEVELNRKFYKEILQNSLLLEERSREFDKQKEKLEAEKTDNSKIINEQKTQVDNLYYQLNEVNRRLAEIYGSDGWKVLKRYYNLKGKLLPDSSGRYKTLKKIISKLRGRKEDPAEGAMSKQLQIDADVKNEYRAVKTYDVIGFSRFELPAVSIVIPAYNGWDLTYKCLASIKENTLGVSYEIIVGDDASTDETKNINNYIKNITVIRNEKNLEFLHNCNHAATYAKGKYILFLNNDTEVRPGWLSSLVDLMEKDQKIGMTGSKLIYPNGKLQEAGAIIWNDASGWNFGYKQDPDAPEFNYVKAVDYISGASILIRTDLWKKIGGFDERYTPAYCEDSDLAFEVREQGYKVIYQPLSEIIHYEGYTHGTDKSEGIKGNEIKAYQKLNNEKFREKWKDVLQKNHFSNGENVFWARDRSQNRKTILVIDHYVPQFDKDAGSKTVFQYLELFVSLNLNVKFIGDNYYRHEPYTTVLQQMGIEVLYGPGYASNWQQWILNNHDKFDYVLLNRPHISVKYIDFIKKNTNAKILYYGHDLHFVRLGKQHEIENKKELLEEADKWREIEISLFNKADIILTPSEEEKESIKSLGIEKDVYAIKPYIYNTIPKPVYDFSERKDVLFIGGFVHAPNVDAVLWFSREIWPMIKKNIAGVRFIIAGSNPPAEINALAGEDISVLGFVSEETLKNLYGKVKLVVIPLRYGAGVKGKTVEAMFHGVPLITTGTGIEGLPGEYSFLTPKDSPADFANEVTRLYNASNEELISMSKKEIQYIHDHFHFDVVKSELQAILNMHTEETMDLTLTNEIL
jgi:GT2 family glycosyltransferase/ubiquinone/menaquinone biosynthesis C-methylase UbiE